MGEEDFKDIKIDDFTVRFRPSPGMPQYDYIEIGICQGGFYGADTETDLNGEKLDQFLEVCARFKEYRDKNKAR